MLLQKRPHGRLELVFAEVKLRLAQERRGFVVDDVAVGGFGGGEVGDGLVDGGGAAGGVGLVGALFDAFVKDLPGVHLGHDLFHRLVRRKGRKTFLQPKIVKPPHRHRVPKPLMRRLMKDQSRPRYEIVLRRLLRKNDRRFPKKRRPRMLHPAKRKLRYQNQIVLRERELVIEILLEIFDGLAVEAKNLGSVRLEFVSLGFADVDL